MYGIVPLSALLQHAAPLPAVVLATVPIAHLRPLHIAVIALYFAMATWVGFYLKGQSNTGEEFFLARAGDDRVKAMHGQER